MHLSLEDSQPTATISLAQFQAGIKKKQSKKNQLQQILEFNSKKMPASTQKNSRVSADSEFNLDSCKKSESAEQKYSFFQEEGRKLLGQVKATKHIQSKFLFVDLLLHICLAALHFSKDYLKLMLVGDLIIIALQAYLQTGGFIKIKDEIRLRAYNTYKYVLLVSMFCLLITVITSSLSMSQIFEIIELCLFVLSIGGLGCEIKLWKVTLETVFIIEQIGKRESLEELDLSDDL